MLSNIIITIRPFFRRASASIIPITANKQLISMETVVIFIVFYRFTHRNNINYLLLLLALYIYPIRTWVDTITFLNHLGLLVSYNVPQNKLNKITESSRLWIKAQASNNKFVNFWDNFEFCKNIYGE